MLKSNKSVDESLISSKDDDNLKFDIRHTAPQHRTHLEYGGFGLVSREISLKMMIFYLILIDLYLEQERQLNDKMPIIKCVQKKHMKMLLPIE